jgi:U3 small nucleolar RNA-associated protein 7
MHLPLLQDVLAMGHSGGLSTMLVPGAGEPHYDSYVADPFQTRKARREQEVHQLLDKLQPDMIVLDPTAIGQVRCLLPGTHARSCTLCLAGSTGH